MRRRRPVKNQDPSEMKHEERLRDLHEKWKSEANRIGDAIPLRRADGTFLELLRYLYTRMIANDRI